MVTPIFSKNGAQRSQGGSVSGGTAIGNTAVRMKPRLLLMEVERLRTDNEELKQENAELRREVTRLRLYNQLEVAGANPYSADCFPQSIPESLRKFFLILPPTMQQREFYDIAQDLGYGLEYSQFILSQFLSERLLVRSGPDELRKVDLGQFELPLV